VSHHLSAGFKSLFTQITYEGIDVLRQSCGGAGFSAWSGLPHLVQLYAPNTTFEGDNTLMAQQSSRLILKNFVNIKRGNDASGLFSYLNDAEKLCKSKCSAYNKEQILNHDVLEEALKVRAAFVIT